MAHLPINFDECGSNPIWRTSKLSLFWHHVFNYKIAQKEITYLTFAKYLAGCPSTPELSHTTNHCRHKAPPTDTHDPVLKISLQTEMGISLPWISLGVCLFVSLDFAFLRWWTRPQHGNSLRQSLRHSRKELANENRSANGLYGIMAANLFPKLWNYAYTMCETA